MQGECVNCCGEAVEEYRIRIDSDRRIDAELCSVCAAELDAESFISVVRLVSQ